MIEPGLTGIVGPNGCGKSNLVEALKWVMAETSPKAMRGGEMDDVIFGGTSDRPARNIAEVSLLIDNHDRKAPAAFNDHELLEASRRIERGMGSLYRVNGREVRARDVQLLFADAATGAHSTAIVSQGQIGSLVAARPTDRRALLEEAAGITGIHSRRHEADLRLRAAENNLARLDDVIVTLEAQLQNLKRQVRQASRYRKHQRPHPAHGGPTSVSAPAAHGRRARGRKRSTCGSRRPRRRIDRGSRHVSDRPRRRRQRGCRRCDRRKRKRRHSFIGLRSRAKPSTPKPRVSRRHDRKCEHRLEQIERDSAREQARIADATAAIQRLQADLTILQAEQAQESESHESARQRVESAAAAASELEVQFTELTAEIGAREARRADLGRQRDDAEARSERLSNRARQIAADRAEIEASTVDLATLQSAGGYARSSAPRSGIRAAAGS